MPLNAYGFNRVTISCYTSPLLISCGFVRLYAAKTYFISSKRGLSSAPFRIHDAERKAIFPCQIIGSFLPDLPVSLRPLRFASSSSTYSQRTTSLAWHATRTRSAATPRRIHDDIHAQCHEADTRTSQDDSIERATGDELMSGLANDSATQLNTDVPQQRSGNIHEKDDGSAWPIDILLPQAFSSAANAHFLKHGASRETRKAQFRHDDAPAQDDISWGDVFDFLRIHSDFTPLTHRAVRIYGPLLELHRLRKRLQSQSVAIEPIVRFGRVWSVIISGAMPALQHVYQAVEGSKRIKVVETGEALDQTRQSTPVTRKYNQSPLKSASLERDVIDITGHSSKGPAPDTIERLIRLFSEDRRSRKVSQKAFRMAINYLVNNRFYTRAHELLAILEDLDLKPTPSIYNTVLRGCTKHQNLRVFQDILKKMTLNGLKPNGTSWICFFKITPDAQRKTIVLREMKRRGYLEHENARYYAAEPIIRDGLGTHIDNGGSLASYMSALTDIFGPQWHSPGSVHTMVDVLVTRDKLKDAMYLLRLLQTKYSFAPSTSTLNIFVRHYHTQRDLQRLTQTLSVFHRTWPSIEVNTFTMYRIWRLAWNLRYYNVARAVWKYSCAMNMMTSDMRINVYTSLWQCLRAAGQGEESPKITSNREKWMQTAGCVILGKAIDGQTLGTGTWTEDTASRAKSLAYDWVREDITTPDTSLSSQSFVTALERAWKRDREMALRGEKKRMLEMARMTGNRWIESHELAASDR